MRALEAWFIKSRCGTKNFSCAFHFQTPLSEILDLPLKYHYHSIAEDGTGEADVSISLVTADHPQVVEAVTIATEKARNSLIEITEEMYVEALKTGIAAAENKRRENKPCGAK